MTDVTNVTGALTIDAELGRKASKGFAVDETYWGYIIRKDGNGNVGVAVAQVIAMVFGAAFVAAALGLVLMPAALMGSVDMVMRSGAAVLFGGMAAYLLWFASRGADSEFQVDNSLGEVREVVRNRAGRPTLVGRYGYDAIGGVFLDREKDGRARLVLRYRNTAQTLQVASGREADLEVLRNRMGRDLMMAIVPSHQVQAGTTIAPVSRRRVA